MLVDSFVVGDSGYGSQPVLPVNEVGPGVVIASWGDYGTRGAHCERVGPWGSSGLFRERSPSWLTDDDNRSRTHARSHARASLAALGAVTASRISHAAEKESHTRRIRFVLSVCPAVKALVFERANHSPAVCAETVHCLGNPAKRYTTSPIAKVDI